MTQVNRILLFSFFIVAHIYARGGTMTKVRTQRQFDDAVARINNGEEMHIKLASRRFVLNGKIDATSSLSLFGKDAAIIHYTSFYQQNEAVLQKGAYNIYHLKEKLTYFPLFYDKNGELLPVVESVKNSIGVNMVEGQLDCPTTFSEGTYFKIPISSNLVHLGKKTFSNAFGYLDCGWDVAKFSVEHSDGKYFYCKILINSTIDNLQYDQQVYHKPIRYVIYNAELKDNSIFYDSDYLYVPKNMGDVYCVNREKLSKQEPTITTHSNVKLKGISFSGMDGIVIKSNKTTTCEISDCIFQNTLGRALTIEKSNGTDVQPDNIRECTFMNCSVFSDQAVFLSSSVDGDNCINFEQCVVSKYPDGVVGYKNPRASVYAIGNVTLTGNVIYNSIRDHFFLNQGRIVARGNILYNTDDFNTRTNRNLSSDWGLVYCNHIFKDTKEALANTNHKILLDSNMIYGAYAYGGDARGVFIDDGRGDVTCRDNIVLNTQTYSIDSRNVKMTEASSVRNRLEGNIVSSQYRLVYGSAVKGNNIPVTKANVLLSQNDNITSELQVDSKDFHEDLDIECFIDDNKVFVSKDLYKVIKRSKAWAHVKRHVKKK